MALINYLPTDQAAEKIRPVLEGMAKKTGSVPSIYGALAHSPELFEGFMSLNGALGKTQLDGKLRELVYIKTSELNKCAYCLHYHKMFGKKAGLDDRQINETAQHETSDAYNDLQRDALRYADEVTRHINPSPELFERLKAKLSDRELVELAMAVAIANLTNRFTGTLQFELP